MSTQEQTELPPLETQLLGPTGADAVSGAESDSPLQRFVEANGITVIKAGVVDLDGNMRGKRIEPTHLVEAVNGSGISMCNVVLAWNTQDEVIPGLPYTGWDTGYPDLKVRPDLSTLRLSGEEPGAASVLCDAFEPDGTASPLSPRGILRRVVQRANAAGYSPVCAYELEFYLLHGAPAEQAGRTSTQLESIAAGNQTYSLFRDVKAEAVLADIRSRLRREGVPVEACNSEYGPGQFEINIAYSGALEAADNAVRLKAIVREAAAAAGYTATFMAKLHPEWAGSSGHLHQSLWDTKTGAPIFGNPADPTTLSTVATSYLAGLVETSPELAALYLPTVNSYKRTTAGDWAGSTATWGTDNRTVAIRALPAAGSEARVENRIAGADTNPYLVIAANIAAGLTGIQHSLTPPQQTRTNAYGLAPAKAPPLPQTLEEALTALQNSAIARDWLGERFVEHYTAIKRWELEQQRHAVTDWEIARYLERA